MALSMDTLERFFGGSRRKERMAQEELPVLHPQLQPAQPLFPSPSFIRPTSKSMKPREEERRPRNSDERERTFSLTGRENHHQTSNCASTRRGRQRHVAPTGSTSDTITEDSRSPSPFRFPEDSIFKTVPTTLYSGSSGPVVESMDIVSEESEGSDQDGTCEGVRQTAPAVYEPTGYRPQPRKPCRIQTTINPADLAGLLPSPIIMPSPISPHTAANALTLLENMPPSPIKSIFANKSQTVPLLPRLSRFSTLNLPHLESPATSDSEEDFPGELRQFPSPASLPTPSTWSARESFDSLMGSADAPVSPTKRFRETWGVRGNDPSLMQSIELAISLQDTEASWPVSSTNTQSDSGGELWEPSLDDFLDLEDDDVADDYEILFDSDYKAPTPPPKDTPKIPLSRFNHSGPKGIQKSASNRTVRPNDSQNLLSSVSALSPQSTISSRTSRPLHPSALITTIANTFSFDQIYIMSFLPDDRKRRGRLLVFPTRSQGEPADSPSRHKPKVVGRLLASYGVADAVASWDLPTDVLAEALDANEYWYEYEDPAASPQGLSHGFMCTFYGSCLQPPQPAGATACNSGIVFAAFHTQSHPIIPSASSVDKTELLGNLRSLAKLLVDETRKSL